MASDSPRRPQTSGPHRSGSVSNAFGNVSATIHPQVVSDRSVIDSAIGFINEVTLAAHQQHVDTKDTITWARFESGADLSDPRYGVDWEIKSSMTPPLLLVLGFGIGVQVWAIPANGEAVEVLSWRHGVVTALCVLPTPSKSRNADINDCSDGAEDLFADKRPLVALVDGNAKNTAANAGGNYQSQFSTVSFVSLKTGQQVKTIKFKNPIIDVISNRNTIVITFNERIAVFDAWTLEDRLSITSCYPSPGINSNPVALGARWLAYAECKLIHSKRSSGGCDGEGVASYTATVLNAAKSLGKGLRELGEHVAAGLTGSSSGSVGAKSNCDAGNCTEAKQAGVVTVIDVMQAIKDYSPTSGTPVAFHGGSDAGIAHFIAHSDAIVSMEFDSSGMLLVTADRRGHDFHVFRIQPHPVGSNLSAVHHLYVLHRGDTTSKVQNIAFSSDSRWVAISTLRGTTHVFPITPYGGLIGTRTHASLHVVNKLSRFHRSAGLTADGRSSSPISYSDSTVFSQSLQPYNNPTLPPFPRPTVIMPLAQLRQPLALGSPPGSASLAGVGSVTTNGGKSSQRQRLSSLSDDSSKPLSVCAIFAKSRAGMLEQAGTNREAPHRMQRKSVDSLFIMAGHGSLIQYDLDTKLSSNVAKEKICDDTPIELLVEAKAQWNFGRRRETNSEIIPPLSPDNWLIVNRNSCNLDDSTREFDDDRDYADSWLSQVEIVTHAGPHRRLWMGPQFIFKTYDTPSGSNLSHVDVEAVEIGLTKPSGVSAGISRAERSSPLNMPLGTNLRSSVPVLIESGSYSSIEQSPKFMDRFRHDLLESDCVLSQGDSRLKEDLADAMRESPHVSSVFKENGCCFTPSTPDASLTSENVCLYNAHITPNDEDTNYDNTIQIPSASTIAALASALPNIFSYDTTLPQHPSIEKYVNPLGTVTTITVGMTSDVNTDMLDEVVAQLTAEDSVIHENCDESLFRPVVAIFCDESERKYAEEEKSRNKSDLCRPPEEMGTKLIVPVIAKEMDDQICKLDKENRCSKKILKLKSLGNHEQEEQMESKSKTTLKQKKCASPHVAENPGDNEQILHDSTMNGLVEQITQEEETLQKINSEITEPPAIEVLKNKRSKKPQNVKTVIKDDVIESKTFVKNEGKLKTQPIVERNSQKTFGRTINESPKLELSLLHDLSDSSENVETFKMDFDDKIEVLEASLSQKSWEFTKNPFKNNEAICEESKMSDIKMMETNEITPSYKVKIIEFETTNNKQIKKLNKDDDVGETLHESSTSKTVKKKSKEHENKYNVDASGSTNAIVSPQPSLDIFSNKLTESKTLDAVRQSFQKSFGSDSDELDILSSLEPLPPLPALEPLQLETTPFVQSKCEILQETVIVVDPPKLFESTKLAKESALQNSITLKTSSNNMSNKDTKDYGNMNADETYTNITAAFGDVIKEANKLSKRQKRKLQKNKKEVSTLSNVKPLEIIEIQREEDEELRPLIDKTGSSLSDSQHESVADGSLVSIKCNIINLPATSTDSEGSMPITTSDENVSSENCPISPVTYANKVKTKKIDHQINLNAAIEAAASSSTSTAEESGEEIENKPISMKLDGVVIDRKVSRPSLLAAGEPARVVGLPESATKVTTKKNSKRRKR